MTKSSQNTETLYRVCFMQRTCYQITLRARDEAHAVARAKRRWFSGNADAFMPYAGENDAWDARPE